MLSECSLPGDFKLLTDEDTGIIQYRAQGGRRWIVALSQAETDVGAADADRGDDRMHQATPQMLWSAFDRTHTGDIRQFASLIRGQRKGKRLSVQRFRAGGIEIVVVVILDGVGDISTDAGNSEPANPKGAEQAME
jgi:hypothetical protein